MSANVLPSFAFNDGSNAMLFKPEHPSYFGLCNALGVHLSHQSYVRFINDGLRDCFSKTMSFLADLIRNVLCGGSGKKMAWIHAWRIITGMADKNVFTNFSIRQHVGEAMCGNIFCNLSSSNAELTVSAAIPPGSPYPASAQIVENWPILIDLGPESTNRVISLFRLAFSAAKSTCSDFNYVRFNVKTLAANFAFAVCGEDFCGHYLLCQELT